MIFDEKFWLAVSFVLFVIFTYKPIKKAILGIIDRRIDMIRSDLENAENMRIKAKTTLAELEKKFNFTIEERKSLVIAAKDDIDKISKESEIELEMMIKLKENDAQNRLEQLKTIAANDLKATFSTAAKNVVHKYIHEQKSKFPSDVQLASNLLKK